MSISKSQSPDRAAWVHELLAEYEQPLTQYAARLTGNLEAARDVVQETFLRLCRLEPGSIDGRVAAWLYTVCRNRALDVRRKESRMKPLSAANLETPTGSERNPAEVAETRDGAGQALQALTHLPENQQEVVRLRFQAGLSYKEIAEVTRLSVSNVGYLIHTALKTIREQLA